MEEAVHDTMTKIHWEGRRFCLGKLEECPEIMAQGRTLRELEENLKDAYITMVMEDVPAEHHEKAIGV